MEYSTEQKTIIDAVLSGKNCLVNAVAGSGKTTTVMGLAEFAPEKNIVQITYNRHLKDEVVAKISANKKIKSDTDTFNNDGNTEIWTYIPNSSYTEWSIKQEPDMESPVIGKIKQNHRFKVFEKKGIWFKINYKTIVGYIRSELPSETTGIYEPNKYIQKCFKNTNLSVYTYHGLCVRFYNRTAYNDSVIDKVVFTDKKPSLELPKVDILVIDETQDMTLLYYKLIKKFIKDLKNLPTILLLGDVNQGIYEFKKSDRRFLSLGDQLFADHGPFLRLTLRTSYRLTDSISSFLNEIMLGENRIVTQKAGPKVAYIRADIWSDASAIVCKIILDLLLTKKYKCDDIFILSASVLSKKEGISLPINKLENMLVSKGVQCFTSMNDESAINKDVANGKVVFSTFHQAKGRERPVVIVYGFDSNWFKYYGKNKDKTICPKELYVAVTRAKERLILVEGVDPESDVTPLPFLKYINDNFTEFKNKPYLALNGLQPKVKTQHQLEEKEEMRTSPSDLLKFIADDTLRSLVFMKEALFTRINAPSKDINIPVKINNNIGLLENVSDINGLALPMIWETQKKGTSSIYNYITSKCNVSDIIEENIKTLPSTPSLPEDFLKIANIYQALTSGFHFKLAQIDKYDWLTTEHITACHALMNSYLDVAVQFEKEIEEVIYTKLAKGVVSICGRLDAFDKNAVYEFKCVSELTIEHFLQLIIYAWLWTQPSDENQKSLFEIYGQRKFLLINLRTDEIHELNTHSTYIDDVVDLLIENKFVNNTINISDNDFIHHCLTEEKPAIISESVNLSLNTMDELKRICKERNIKVGKSSKPELIEKILNPNKEIKPLESYSCSDLANLLKEKNIKGKKGTKIEMINALKNSTASQTMMKAFLNKSSNQVISK